MATLQLLVKSSCCSTALLTLCLADRANSPAPSLARGTAGAQRTSGMLQRAVVAGRGTFGSTRPIPVVEAERPGDGLARLRQFDSARRRHGHGHLAIIHLQ